MRGEGGKPSLKRFSAFPLPPFLLPQTSDRKERLRSYEGEFPCPTSTGSPSGAPVGGPACLSSAVNSKVCAEMTPLPSTAYIRSDQVSIKKIILIKGTGNIHLISGLFRQRIAYFCALPQLVRRQNNIMRIIHQIF